MPLPNNFSPYEHLQSVLLQTYNRIVREEFADADTDDINTPRSSLRTACLLRDDDSAIQSLLRMMLLYFVLRKAADLQTPIYGVPVPSYQEARQFQPQIQLYFQEDAADVEPGFSPVTGEISFRLVNETAQSLSEGELRSIANRIRSNFANSNGFVWRKGKVMVTYTDRQRGYKLQLLCRSEAEARRVIGNVLDIQGHTPDWQFLNVSNNAEPSQRYPTIARSESVLGRSRRMPRQRPIADVRFIYACCHIRGLPNPVILIDRSGYHRRPLVEAS
ncbi:hypothetical protein H6F67_10110 [Microcoleus sp. FACHB-1515]|uniref:hypothetical protein n=1 Tax=Cyanophyceae TaxID=3028117 RepID=UPI00168489A3|nr:hypothetical protein [Microcoleus sp. FACHB-1515]MBD2090205.1 hypothetical protein [Microcoleus sp. FACHB-1515]